MIYTDQFTPWRKSEVVVKTKGPRVAKNIYETQCLLLNLKLCGMQRKHGGKR